MSTSPAKLKPAQGVPNSAPVDVTKEYVVGTGPWSARIGAILSQFTDDAEWMIGADVYERMARDPVVAKDINYQKISCLADGVQCHPVSLEKTDVRLDLAREIADFCQRNLDNLQRPIEDICREMMNALKRAHTVAEVTYNDPQPTGIDAYKLTLKSIKVKPRHTTAFVVDPFMNVLGLTAWRYWGQGVVPSASLPGGQPIIPREKFCVLTFETDNEDPRGVNPLRPAVNYWQGKNLIPGLQLKWLEKSGIPSSIGFTAPGEEAYQQPYDDSGQPEYENGSAVVRTAQEIMASRLADLESGSAAAFPNGAAVQSHQVAGDGSQFTRAYEDFDSQIEFALLLQKLATREGRHQTRASTSTHKDILDSLVWARKEAIATMLKREVLKNLVFYNYGEENLDLVPDVMLGDAEGKDWAADAAAAAALGPSLTDSQWIALCQQIGINAPEEGEVLPSRVKASGSGGGADPGAADGAQL